MKENNIRKYAKLMEELGLTGLEVTENNQVVRLERSPGQSLKVDLQESLDAADISDVAAGGGADVLSPMVGTFYAAPAENAEPYVQVGDYVKKGDTLCIIEALKLMNEVIAEDDGVIQEMCVSDGQVVEYGTVLFRMGGE